MILSEPGPIPQAPVGQFCRHNLSPRGDGNRFTTSGSTRLHDTTYPREGTETLWHSHPSLIALDTTYPREGTETHTKRRRSTWGRTTQLIPARGRKLRQPQSAQLQRRTQLIPARGRKRKFLRGRGPLRRTQLIPARGRKPTAPTGLSATRGHNLSPRGDGNLLLIHGIRDTLTDTTYPREGTETVCDKLAAYEDTGHNLSPRGDGNPFKSRMSCWHSRTQLIPARGRKPGS